jgi:hypothetical protein
VEMDNEIETEAPPPVSSLRSRWEAMSKKPDGPDEPKGAKPSLFGAKASKYAEFLLTLLILSSGYSKPQNRRSSSNPNSHCIVCNLLWRTRYSSKTRSIQPYQSADVSGGCSIPFLFPQNPLQVVVEFKRRQDRQRIYRK